MRLEARTAHGCLVSGRIHEPERWLEPAAVRPVRSQPKKGDAAGLKVGRVCDPPSGAKRAGHRPALPQAERTRDDRGDADSGEDFA